HLPKNMAQRQNAKYPERIDEKFPTNVFVDLAFDRHKVRQKIFMRKLDTFRRGRCARSENDLDRVALSDIFGVVMFCRMTGNFPSQTLDRELWMINVSVIDVLAIENQFWLGLVTDSLRKIERTLLVKRHSDRAPQDDSIKCYDPLWRVFRPDQNAITMSDAT